VSSTKPPRGHKIPLLIAQLESAGAHVTPVSDLASAWDYVAKLSWSSNAKRIVVCCRGLTTELLPPRVALGSSEIAVQAKMPRDEFFASLRRADIGVTFADLAIAETGTLVIATSDESERLATSLPRIHVGILPSSRIVYSLLDAEPHLSKFLAQASRGVAISLISGASRTADIGGRLVMGVHGPRELHICLLEQELPGGH